VALAKLSAEFYLAKAIYTNSISLAEVRSNSNLAIATFDQL
jgi:hypothetical protein